MVQHWDRKLIFEIQTLCYFWQTPMMILITGETDCRVLTF